MHILIIPSWYPTKDNPINGIFFREQAHALKKAGHQVGVIYPERRSLRKFNVKNIKRTIVYEDDNGIPTIRTRGWYWFPRIPYANAKLFIDDGLELFVQYKNRYGTPDILHIHSILFGGVLGARISDKYKVPFVVTEHSTAFARNLIKPWQREYLTEVYTKTDKLITVSPELGEGLNKKYECPKDILGFVPNIVNTTFFTPNSCTKSRKKFVFLTVSLLTTKKGHKYLLDAFAKKFRNQTDIELWVGGDGEEKANLESYAQELGIEKQVRFLGLLSREQVREMMRQCDVFVLPSLYETFGVVVIEAMACGKPVIATRCGGPECIVNDVNGVLVPKEDADVLACAMEEMMQSIDAYHPDLIRNECISHFSEEAVVEQLNNIYNTAIERHKVNK